MNWQLVPAFRLLLPILFGIICAIAFPNQSNFAIILFLLSLISYFYFVFIKVSLSKIWLLGASLTLSLFAFGYWRTDIVDEQKKATHFSRISPENEENIFMIKIYEVEEKETHFNIFATVISCKQNVATGNIQVFLHKNDTLTPPQYLPNYGDICWLKATPRLIIAQKNPENFDYQKYLHFKNIHFQTFVHEKNIKLVATRRGNLLKTFALDCRNHFLYLLKKNLSTPNEWGVGAALLLGYRAAALDEVRPAYVETGAMHILAVSGMHVGLLYEAVVLLLGLVRRWQSPRGKWVQSFVILLLVWWFVLLTGAGGSVLRAGAMFSFLEIGRRLQRLTSIWNLLAASLLVLLLINPFLLVDVGFQLSYLAVSGILFFFPRIYKIFYFKNIVLNWAWNVTAMGIAAQLIVTPLSLYYFHRFPTYFWLSGLLAIPTSTIAMFVGILLFIFDSVPFLGSLLGKLLWLMLWLMNQSIFFVQKLPPLSTFQNVWLSGVTAIGLYLVLFGICYSIWKKQLRFVAWTLVLVVILLCNHLFRQIKTNNLRSLAIFYVPKSSVFEIFDKKKCITILSKNIDEKKVKLVNENLHIKLNIKDIQILNFNQSYQSDNCLYINGFLQFYDKKMIVLDNSKKNFVPLRRNSNEKDNNTNNLINQLANLRQTYLQFPLQTDFIFLRDDYPLSIADVQTIFQAKMYIFDASNHRKRVEAWLNECKQLGIIAHDVAKQGAWIYNYE